MVKNCRSLHRKTKPVIQIVDHTLPQNPWSGQRPVAPPGYTGPRCGCRDAAHKASDCPVPGTPPALPCGGPGETSPRLPQTPTYDIDMYTTESKPPLEEPMKLLTTDLSEEVTRSMSATDGYEIQSPK